MKHTGDTTGQAVLVWTDNNPLSKMKEVTACSWLSPAGVQGCGLFDAAAAGGRDVEA